MKPKVLVLAACLILCQSVYSAPFSLGTGFSYQGRLTEGGQLANGTFRFYFELFDAPLGGSLLAAWELEELEVANGLFVAELDFGTARFNGEARWLQISVQGTNGLTLLNPRQQIFPTPYALFTPVAGGVTNGAITAAMIAPGAVTTAKLADASVTSAKLAPGTVITNIPATTNNLALGTASLDGRLDIYRTGVGTPALQLLGSQNLFRIFSDDSLEKTRLDAGLGWGQLQLNNNSAAGQRAAILTANATGGGSLTLYNSNGNQRAQLFGANAGGELSLNGADGLEKARLQTGSNLGSLVLNNNFGVQGALCVANFINGGGLLTLNNTSGQNRVILDGGSSGGKMSLNNAAGALSVDVRSQFSAGNTAAWMSLNDNGAARVTFAARSGSSGVGGLIGVLNGSGVPTVLIAADTGAGKGQVTTSILQITGGSDLSEQFDVETKEDAVRPGMVVCIDPRNPGKLVLSTKAYDRTVAGIVSGAGGVSPGMLMGQQGTVADGKHPIALTGRVYCLAEAEPNAIHPGDLLTTSARPGHAMKVGNHEQAQGAIIGKAMTHLEKGQGLVLVLVTLQ